MQLIDVLNSVANI